MPFDSIGFDGYWNAATNRKIGQAGPGLIAAPRQAVQLWKVVVAGNTVLNAVSSWNVGDYAFYNGYEWDKLIGQGSLTSQVNAAVAAFLGSLPTSPPAGGPGLWLDGNVVVFS